MDKQGKREWILEESISDSSSSSEDERPQKLPRSNSKDDNNMKWLDWEIMQIVAESEFGMLPQPCDPRLGSVWIVSVAIRTPNVSLAETVRSKGNPNNTNSNTTNNNSIAAGTLAKESSLSGGDLLLLSSASWDHPLLGIVQPWDPDYDWKFSMLLFLKLKKVN